MKKKIIVGALVATMAASILSNGGYEIVASTTEGKSDLLIKAHDASQPEVEEVGIEYMGKYILFQGKVVSINEKEGYKSVLIADNKQEMVANIADKTLVFSQKEGALTGLDKLQNEDEVAIIYDVYTPVALSYPPIVSDIKALVIKDKNYVANLGIINEKFRENRGLFEIIDSKQMKVLPITDSKKDLKTKDLVGSEALFFFKQSEIDKQLTMSITPKYNVDIAILVSSKEELARYKEEKEILKQELDKEMKASKYVPLRKLAEAKGYKVEWFGMDKPIVLTKNDIKVEVTLNTKTLSYSHRTRDIQPLDNVKELDLMTKLDGSTTMVSSKFIDMLL